MTVELQGLGCSFGNVGCPSSRGVFGRFFQDVRHDDVLAIAFEDTPTEWSLAITEVDCDDVSCGWITGEVASANDIPLPTGLTAGDPILISVRTIATIDKVATP